MRSNMDDNNRQKEKTVHASLTTQQKNTSNLKQKSHRGFLEGASPQNYCDH